MRHPNRELSEYDYRDIEELSNKNLLIWAEKKSGIGSVISRKEEVANRIEQSRESRKRTISLLKEIVILSGFTIGFSLLLLPLGDILTVATSSVILVIIIGLSFYTLFRTIIAIFEIITTRSDESKKK